MLLPSATPSLKPSATVTVQSLIDAAAEAAIGGNAPAAAEANPAADAIQGAVQVQITTRQRAFLRVIVDGEIAFNGRLAPGGIQAFAGKKSIEILSGDAAALQITYNGAELGVLGETGEVVNFILAPDGMQTTTPTITPTPTRTPRTTRTPQATQNP